jgi:hypothetical protein
MIANVCEIADFPTFKNNVFQKVFHTLNIMTDIFQYTVTKLKKISKEIHKNPVTIVDLRAYN